MLMMFAVVNETRGNKLDLVASGGLYIFYMTPVLFIHFDTIFLNV